MVDALVSGASAARRAGSSPVLGTIRKVNYLFFKQLAFYISDYWQPSDNLYKKTASRRFP